MPKVETVMIKNDTPDGGYILINKADFKEENMELFEGGIPKVDNSKDHEGLTKEKAEDQMKATPDELFAEDLQKMDAAQCKEVLDLFGIEYNKNLGVKKLREAVAEIRSVLTASE